MGFAAGRRLFRLVAGLAWAAWVHAAEPLPVLKIDPAQVSVSGLSSGGFMAVQMHVAYAGTFTRGAGVVAGGPFYCAEGSLAQALGRCMKPGAPIPVAALADATRRWAREGFVDPVERLQSGRVYLFSGTRDPTVAPSVVEALQAYYRHFLPESRIRLRRNVPAGHGMVTDDTGAACGTTAKPHIVDCDLDLAGEMLRHLHGLVGGRNDGELRGRFVAFDQTAFVRGHGMGPEGWAYIPADCTAAHACGLHVVFHGCGQNVASIGERYVRGTGYNRWADAHHLIVLYPQTGPGAVNGCWDWWGYDSDDYAWKRGPQMAAVRAMVARLAGEELNLPPTASGGCIAATNAEHVQAGRAYYWWGAVLAAGSNQRVGWWPIGSSTLRRTGPRRYEPADASTCPR